MSSKDPRPVQEIQQEYTNLCTRAGHTQYQISTLQKDLAILNDSLRDLNAEASASQQAAEASKAAEAPKAEESKEQAAE